MQLLLIGRPAAANRRAQMSARAVHSPRPRVCQGVRKGKTTPPTAASSLDETHVVLIRAVRRSAALTYPTPMLLTT